MSLWSAALFRRFCFSCFKNKSGGKAPHSKKEGDPMGRAKKAVGLSLGLMVLLLLSFAGCSAPPSPWPPGKSPKVLTSFPPLYCFAANVVTDDAHVMSLLTTVGPHDYK